MPQLSVIVSVVRKGWGDTVLAATMKAGAQGGTALSGRGVGRNEQQKVFGIQIMPEKEIILTVVRSSDVDAILAEVMRAAELGEPGNGLAFAVPLQKLIGAANLLQEEEQPPA